MVSVKISHSLLCLMGLAFVFPSHAQNSQQDYVDAHDSARATVGVGAVTWDNTVAAFAQNYANQRIGDCALVHSGGGGIYGENLAWSSGDLSGTDAVKMWVDEKPDYNYNVIGAPGKVYLSSTDAVRTWVNEGADYNDNVNTCAPGKVCGHYTQVVWRNSVRIGCAKVRCNNGGTFIGCNCAPGNYVG